MLTILACTGSVGAAASDDDSFLSYSGTATTQRSDEFLYRENHVLRFRNGKIAERVVLYTCRDGAPFARKTVSYVDSLMPDFTLEDESTGMREGVRTQNDVREVFFRGDRSDAEKSSSLVRAPGVVADTGFDEFVRDNWVPLMRGDVLGMRFLVPSRLQVMGFLVKHVGSDRLDGRPVELFRLKLSGVLGWVAPSIDVYYSTADHVLVRYVGLSDLRDAAHANFKAAIVFPLSERRPVGATEMANAERVRLVPCK